MVQPRKIPKLDLAAEFNKSADLDESPALFGKYRGQTPCWIAEHDPQYLIWAYETFDKERKPCSKELYDACKLDEYEEDNPDLPEEGSFAELSGILNFRK